ncbi:hypothetical protein MBANPS3_007610 [Mucor bainieri]
MDVQPFVIENEDGRDTVHTASIDDDRLSYLISTKKINTIPIRNDTYSEIIPTQLETLNQDWNNNKHLAAVCAQLLAGSILVNKEQILMVNCIEVYNRFRHLDSYAERHNPRSNSLPTGQELYETLAIRNVINCNKDRLLVIGTHDITGLVTSSIRLDKELAPELGPSTINFNPCHSTQLFLSNDSIKKATKLLVQKQACVNVYDKYAQLKQVRSDFTIPTAYRLGRCCSRFTDNTFLRPYTLFTANTMEAEDEQMSDLKLGSKLFRPIATSCVFENKKSITKDKIQSSAMIKDTFVSSAHQKIFGLFNNNEAEKSTSAATSPYYRENIDGDCYALSSILPSYNASNNAN